MSNERDVIRAGASLVKWDTDRWLTPKDLIAPTVVCVHGFTSHGRYMQDLAAYLEGYEFVASLFHYDSYLGIDKAAEELMDRLQFLLSPLMKYGFVLIGHSMGGLVARVFARRVTSPLRDLLRGVALLGTPNGGALGGSLVVSAMLDWADWLTGPNPYARSPLCLSALQLTLNDKEKVIHDLNKQDREDPPKIPILSISGGQNYLEFGKPSARAFTGAVRNTLLQRLIGENPNDGLVAESSANLSQVLGISTSLMQHQNKYADYRRTNHTHLIRNQAITNLIVQWLQKDLSL